MAEYIDREAAISLIKQYGHDAIDGGRYSLDTVDDCIELANRIEALPAASVVPIVRCKYCSWYQSVGDDGDDFEVCNYYNREVMGHQFCSEAEPYKTTDEKVKFRQIVGLDKEG